ncbi:H-X9-DG-CTERM domain-containing protein [Cecembia rubra]
MGTCNFIYCDGHVHHDDA